MDERHSSSFSYQTDQCVTEQYGAGYHLHTAVQDSKVLSYVIVNNKGLSTDPCGTPAVQTKFSL